jgi:hypothetical protein
MPRLVELVSPSPEWSAGRPHSLISP